MSTPSDRNSQFLGRYVSQPYLVIYTDEEGTPSCILYPRQDDRYEYYGLLAYDLVRHIARAFKISDDDVWRIAIGTGTVPPTRKPQKPDAAALSRAPVGVPLIVDPHVVMYEEEDGAVGCRLVFLPEDRYETYAGLVRVMVRQIATTFDVPVEHVWEWTQRERIKPSTEIRNPG